MATAIQTISGEIQAQPLNDNYSFLNERKNDLAINVKDYGAVGDGVTDDTTAIQNAFDAADDNRIIFDGSKTYLIDPITITTSAEIIGNNATLKCKSSSTILMTFSTNNIVMEKLILDGDDKANIGIKISDNLSNIKIHFCEIKNFFRNDIINPVVYGINCSTNGTNNISICNNNIHNIHSVANAVVGDDDGVARGINFTYFSTVWVESKNIEVLNNRIYDVYPEEDGDGLAVNTYTGNGTDITIANNHFENCKKRGIKITNASGKISIHDNIIIQTDLATVMYAGISIYGQDTSCYNNKIDAQYCNHGIDVGTTVGGNINISENYIILKDADTVGTDSTHGIKITTYTKDIKISKNTIEYGRYGVEFHANVDYIIIIDNTFINTRTAAIRGSSFSVTAIKNLIIVGNLMQTAAGTYGIRFQYSVNVLTIDSLTIVGNSGTYTIFEDISSSNVVTYKFQSNNELGEYGTSANRTAFPFPSVGQHFFDTGLGYPVWWDGSNWVDATGASV